jgi:hypothetical protein
MNFSGLIIGAGVFRFRAEALGGSSVIDSDLAAGK